MRLKNCIVCEREIPKYRLNTNYRTVVTCSKICSNRWNTMPSKIRNKIYEEIKI